jgi:phosphatidylserine/phosphatidylglycerophosphate/cardiolipin synthase-like enzyme
MAGEITAGSRATSPGIRIHAERSWDCDAFAVRAIDGDEREILVGAYRLTVGSGVVGALIHAKECGVDVRLLADREAPCGRASGVDPLATAGVLGFVSRHCKSSYGDDRNVFGGPVTLSAARRQCRLAQAEK